ncbi:hypothetical protein BD413DRAFT_609703 [Trametes elegans]|nr:hypothetical protein BD413DRAFT_609703 [Trametes elegans]
MESKPASSTRARASITASTPTRVSTLTSVPPPAYNDPHYWLPDPDSVPSPSTNDDHDDPKPPALPPRPYPFAKPRTGLAGPALSGDDPRGTLDRVRNFAPGKTPHELLSPPPPPFQRDVPPGIPQAPFATMVLDGAGTALDKGFPYAAPPCTTTGQHPFATHDVEERDWRRFIHDVRVAGSLSPTNWVVSSLTPVAVAPFGMFFGYQIVHGMNNMMRRRKRGPVQQLIDCWNDYFFHPRNLHVALVQGQVRYLRHGQSVPEDDDKRWRMVVSYRPSFFPVLSTAERKG